MSDSLPPPMRVISEVEAETVDFHVCPRVADLAREAVVPGSKQAVCIMCREPVWYAPTSPILPPKICPMCALSELATRGGGPGRK